MYIGGHYRWVYPDDPAGQRTPQDWPYSYSYHYLWGDEFRGKAPEGCDIAHSDRIFQNEPTAKEVWGRVIGRNQSWSEAKPEALSQFLSEVFGVPTEAKALAAGCDQNNGRPLWIVWFTKS